MENPVAIAIPELMASGAKIKGAAEDLALGIPLVVNTAENIGTDADALTTMRNNYEQGKVVLATGRATLLSVIMAVRVFIALGRDMMKPLFGAMYSEAYDILGFSNDSLAVPFTAEELLPMLQAYKAFYVANPLRENAPNNLTAAQAQVFYDQLNAATNSLSQASAQQITRKSERDDAATTLRKRIRDVIKELEMKIDPLDARWVAFGFNLPGMESTPEIPEGLEVTLLGATTASLRWKKTARAGHYRVWYRLHNSDQDYVAAGSPADIDFTLAGLPATSEVDIAISAVNDGGESQRSVVVTITTH